MPEPIRLPPQAEACELCARVLPLTRHHLIPKALHGKTYVQKRFAKTERITATLWVCRACHNHIHATFSEKELALAYNSREALLENASIRAFAHWLGSKPAGFMPKR